jgi:23S rRNA (adenine2503-C2)-methyltransferase
MGMGEPFLNYDSFMGAVRLLVKRSWPEPAADDGFHLRHRPRHRAICPGAGGVRPKLAISLNAPNDLDP